MQNDLLHRVLVDKLVTDQVRTARARRRHLLQCIVVSASPEYTPSLC